MERLGLWVCLFNVTGAVRVDAVSSNTPIIIEEIAPYKTLLVHHRLSRELDLLQANNCASFHSKISHSKINLRSNSKALAKRSLQSCFSNKFGSLPNLLSVELKFFERY